MAANTDFQTPDCAGCGCVTDGSCLCLFPGDAYDFEPAKNSGQPFAEVYKRTDGETLFLCASDALAVRLVSILGGCKS